tara:strand:- start:755 stop:1609 length:855 start_codon:yes stop_codon:yes gene_type:complete
MKTIKEIYSALYGNYKNDDSYFDRVMQCNDTEYIPKVSNAGDVIESGDEKHQVMHNGVLIHEGCYHQSWVTEIITALKGHHEPQEEKLFYEILKYVPKNGTMIELGSFWAYYSLWFNKEISDAKNIMVEPNPFKADIGRNNFKLNEFDGEFLNAYVADSYEEKSTYTDEVGNYDIPKVSVDWLLEHYSIDKLDILHADIQNNEMQLLNGSTDSLAKSKIDFIFLATHNTYVHEEIRNVLQYHDYHIVEEYYPHESFFDDGLVLACSSDVILNIDTSKLKISKKG